MDDVYFEIEDFKGRTIVCERVRWFDHITENAHHNYMDGSEEDVIQALKNPHNLHRCFDRVRKNRRVYYLHHPHWGDFTKVVVEYDNDNCDGTGKVCTAYKVDDITPGERPEF